MDYMVWREIATLAEEEGIREMSFTVLVKRSTGNEDIYTCDSVHKEPHALILRGDSLNTSTGVEVLGPDGHTMSLDWDRQIDPVAYGDGIGGASVYVMNTKGSTIANYFLPATGDKTSGRITKDNTTILLKLSPGRDLEFYPEGREFSILDICLPYSLGDLERTDRTPKISREGGIKSFLVTAKTKDFTEQFVFDVENTFSAKFPSDWDLSNKRVISFKSSESNTCGFGMFLSAAKTTSGGHESIIGKTFGYVPFYFDIEYKIDCLTGVARFDAYNITSYSDKISFTIDRISLNVYGDYS